MSKTMIDLAKEYSVTTEQTESKDKYYPELRIESDSPILFGDGEQSYEIKGEVISSTMRDDDGEKCYSYCLKVKQIGVDSSEEGNSKPSSINSTMEKLLKSFSGMEED